MLLSKMKLIHFFRVENEGLGSELSPLHLSLITAAFRGLKLRPHRAPRTPRTLHMLCIYATPATYAMFAIRTEKYLTELQGFWTFSIVLCLGNKRTTFRKLDLFPSLGEEGKKTPTHLRKSCSQSLLLLTLWLATESATHATYGTLCDQSQRQ
jgi:hypothetical protein